MPQKYGLKFKGRPLGIVLVTTLFTVVLVVMMVTAVVHSGASGLSLTASFYDREAALLAAESGVQYAITRLQQNGDWRGNNSDVSDANTDFQVVEDNGNVFGVISTGTDKRQSAFRIKFSYEEGADKPSQSCNFIKSRYVSTNNINGRSSVAVVPANENGVGRDLSADANQYSYKIPRCTASIIVEGLSGPGIRELKKSGRTFRDENGVIVNDERWRDRTVSRIVEYYLAYDASDIVDAAAFAGGTLSADVKENFLISIDDKDYTSRIRTLGDAYIKAGGRFAPGTEVAIGGSNASVQDGENTSFIRGSSDTDNFESIQLSWNEVKKSSTSNPIPAGTYVWTTQGLMYSDKGMTLEEISSHDDSYFSDLNGFKKASSLTSRTPNIDLESGGGKYKILVKGDAYVQPQGDNKNIVIGSSSSIKVRPVVYFSPGENDNMSATLTSEGDISIEGAIVGAGSMTAGGNVDFQGPSILESNPDVGVSIYAQGDVNLKEITKLTADAQEVGIDIDQELDKSDSEKIIEDANKLVNPDDVSTSPGDSGDDAGQRRWEQYNQQLQKDPNYTLSYCDQEIVGVIYAWGNFSADLPNSQLNVRGTVVSYGADRPITVSQRPKSRGKGKGSKHYTTTTMQSQEGDMFIKAKNVDLTYDPTYFRELLADQNKLSLKIKKSLWATW